MDGNNCCLFPIRYRFLGLLIRPRNDRQRLLVRGDPFEAVVPHRLGGGVADARMKRNAQPVGAFAVEIAQGFVEASRAVGRDMVILGALRGRDPAR